MYNVNVFRGDIKADLLMHGVTGVGEADWVFKRTFKLSEKQKAQPWIDLVFEGLDTFCTIRLVSRS